MKKSLKSAVLAFALLTVMLGIPANGLAQVAGVIGVKFGFSVASGYSTSDDLAPTDAAGILVDGVEAVTNWNNLLSDNSPSLTANIGNTWNIAQDSAGNALSGVTMTPVGFDDGRNSGGNDCADGRLLYDMWKFNGSNGHTDPGGHHFITMTFSNLAASQYDVYVYINNNNGNYWGNARANSVFAIGSNLDSSGFNGAQSDPCSLGTPMHTATGFGNPVNYVGMPAVTTTNGGIIVITVVMQGGGDFGVSGVELVPTGTVIGTGPATPGTLLEAPSTAGTAALAGTAVTLTGLATGQPTVTYQWQTDGGNGSAPTNIPGAISTNLVVNTTGWLPGTYVYDFVAANSLGTNTSSTINIKIVSSLMVDIGVSAPTPGPNDISQLLSTTPNDDGFNYYTDNGANNNEWNGQTFTTGSSLTGYVLNSLAWKSAGNGNSFGNFELYDLYIYSLSGTGGTNATLVGSYQIYGGGTENDWLQFQGLNTALAPNTQYAYAFGRDSSASGWEHIGNQGGNPYSGGQLCEIPSQGGAVKYGTMGNSDAVFSIGLGISQAPFANLPTYMPNVTPIYAGTVITLNEFPIGLSPSYQWLTDGGSGGSLTNVPGATSSNLVVDTTSFIAGNYNYAVTVNNSHGSSTSATLTLNVVAASQPQLVTDITPAPVNEGYVGQTLAYSASFTGTLPISYQWTVDTGGGPTNIPGAVSDTLVLTNVQLPNAGIYTLTANNSVGGPVPSSSSTLTVFPDPAAPDANTYGALALSFNPVAYWRFNEANDPSTGVLPTYDFTGNGFFGLYGLNCQNGFNSIVGPQSPTFPGFETNNDAMASVTGVTNSWVTIPPLNLQTNTVTMTMWIYPTANEPTFGGLLYNRPYGAGFGFGGTINGSGMAELGYTWNNNASTTWGFNSGLYPLTGQWSFVALVIQPSQATMYLYYIDPNTSQPVLSSVVSTVTNAPAPFSTTSLIGTDPNDATTILTRGFAGSIDEVAVYNKALTSDQVLQLFGKGAGLSEVAPTASAPVEVPSSANIALLAGRTVTLTTSASGTAPLYYQWQTDGGNGGTLTNIPGATNTTLTINTTGWALGTYNYDYTAANTLGTNTSPEAAITIVSVMMADIGAGAPTPGPNDISQLLNTSQVDDGFNYYTDNGANNNAWNGQTFTTGSNPGGYVLNTLAWKSAGNGNSFSTIQLYDLYIYSLSAGGSTAAVVASYQGYGGGIENDWFQWGGLNTPLAPNTQYAYAFGRDSTATGWEHIADQDGNPYAGGQICQIPSAGGAVVYGNNGTSDATFDIGLQATTPLTVSIAPGAGGNLTLTWPQGILLQATNISGPWVTNSTATSPYQVAPTNSQMYFKFVVP